MAEPKPGPLEALPPEFPELAGAAGELEVAGRGGAELACEGLRCPASFSSASLAAGAGARAGPGAAGDETGGGGGGAGNVVGFDEGAGVCVDATKFL